MDQQVISSQKPSTFSLFSDWYFKQIPKQMMVISKASVRIIWHFFSVGFLCKTLLQPWKRDIAIPISPSLQERFQAFISNLISRFMGFVVRIVTIVTGFLTIAVMSVAGVLLFFLWYLLPLILIFSFCNGLQLLF